MLTPHRAMRAAPGELLCSYVCTAEAKVGALWGGFSSPYVNQKENARCPFQEHPSSIPMPWKSSSRRQHRK